MLVQIKEIMNFNDLMIGRSLLCIRTCVLEMIWIFLDMLLNKDFYKNSDAFIESF